MEKLKITAYADESFKQETGTLEVLMPPKDYQGFRRISYESGRNKGQNVESPVFSGYRNEELTIEIPVDCTGVVEGTKDADTVKKKIQQLEKLVYNYNSSKHQPNFVELAWGTLLFKGRLKEMVVTYSMFAADGTPLRAKIKMVFLQFVSRKEADKLANRQSPDVSHRVVMRGGDTVAALCEEIYGDPSQAAEVARVNGLSSFRRVKPGTVLLFPQLSGHG